MKTIVFVFLLTACGGADVAGLGIEEDPIPFDGGSVADGAGAGGRPTMGSDAGFEDSGRAATGGLRSAGGRAAGGGKATGGRSPGTGGATATGGNTGGVTSTGGSACSLVTHKNGLGGAWEDCVSAGTMSEGQAMAACGSSGADVCRATNCGVDVLVVCGRSADEGYVFGCWGYSGKFAGLAKEGGDSDSCADFNESWY